MSDAYGINWGAIQQPNILGSYLQGQQVKQERQDAVLNRQRQVQQDARSDEEWGLKKQAYADDRQKSQFEIAQARGKALIGVGERLKTVPMGRRKAALDSASALFQAAGVDTAPFANLTEDQLSDENLTTFVGNVAKELEIVNRGGGAYDVVDKSTGGIVRSEKGTPTPFAMDPDKNYYMPDAGGQPAAQPPQGGGGFGAHIGGLLQREGGFVASDGNSNAPANFGINQKHNPDVDVRNLTPEKASQLYKQRYWDAIGADNLPPEAQGAVFDAAVNQGPQAAMQMWQQSGGDVQKFNQLRLARYRQTPGYEKYGRSWERRVAESAGGGSLQGGAGGDTVGAPQVPGMRLIQSAQPKRGGRPATPEEKAAYGIPASVPAQIKADGTIDVIAGAVPKSADPIVSRREVAALRKEFNSLDEVKNFKDVASSYRQVRALATKKNPSAADDIALTFSFMKMLDPGSVVREGEYALVGRTAGLDDQIIMGLQRIDSGKGLTPEIRSKLLNAAASVALQRREAYDQVSGQYRTLAADAGGNPDQFVEDPSKWRGRIKPSGRPQRPQPKPRTQGNGWKVISVE